MEIQLKRKDLIKGLNLGGKLAGKSKVMQIYECVQVTIDSDKLTVKSVSNGNAIKNTVKIDGYTGDKIVFVVSFNDFLSPLQRISSDDIKLEINEKKIDVIYENGKASMPRYRNEEFPLLQNVNGEHTISIPSKTLQNWINVGADFVSKNESQIAMQGIYIYKNSNVIGFCATDSHILANTEIEVEDNCPDFSFIIPNNVFDALKSMLEADEEISFTFDKSRVMFKNSVSSLVTLLLEQRFPNFKSVIPKSEWNVKVDSTQFAEMLDRVSVSLNSGSPLMILKIGNDKIEAHCSDLDFSKDSTEQIKCKSSIEMEIGFNARLLKSIMKHAGNKGNIIMAMTTPERPVLVVNPDENENMRYVIVPMMIR